MKKITLCMCLMFLNTSIAIADNSRSEEQKLFSAWCDAFTAEGLVSLAANRIFGNISTLSDSQFEARSEWVNMNYSLAAERFTERTGEDFEVINIHAMENDWVQYCQLKDQL